ncbi:MAG: hypothetical protein ABIJ09_00275 [Pseudomonadota bacterium]
MNPGRRQLRLSILGLCAWVCACPVPLAGPAALAFECSTDNDCLRDFICDLQRQVCVPGKTSSVDAATVLGDAAAVDRGLVHLDAAGLEHGADAHCDGGSDAAGDAAAADRPADLDGAGVDLTLPADASASRDAAGLDAVELDAAADAAQAQDAAAALDTTPATDSAPGDTLQATDSGADAASSDAATGQDQSTMDQDSGAVDVALADTSVADAVEADAAVADTAVADAALCAEPTPDECAGTCVDLDTDLSHCGTCELSCSGVSPACCGRGCVDTDSDPAHCGNCTTSCHPGISCVGGQCVDACADGSVEQVFDSRMAGCAGSVTYANRDTLCAAGWSACGAQIWVDERAGVAPSHNYWTSDALNWNGAGSGACRALFSGGNTCYPASAPMRVCGARRDSENNECNWINCGLGSNVPNEYFGGCDGNTYAGTLCCRQ